MKVCSVCKANKPKSDYAKRSDTACGVQSRCKPCQKIYNAARTDKRRAYAEKNREYSVAKSKDYYRENRETLLAKKREYYRENRAEILEKARMAQPRTNEYVRKRDAREPAYKVAKVLKARLAHAARTMQQKLTCGRQLRADREKIRLRIEVNFQPGMSWANYGDWQIDHVKPIATFVAQGQDINLANLLCNLRPAWKKQNMVKSSRFKGRHYRFTSGDSAHAHPS